MNKQPKAVKSDDKTTFTLYIILCIIIILLICFMFVLFMIIRKVEFSDSSHKEYDDLRKEIHAIVRDDGLDELSTTVVLNNKLLLINPDYAGWLNIANTKIDYPVVLGNDNEKYLITSFSGQDNPNGSIFMDYRCSGEYDMPHIIIYGHNSTQGQMFGDLKKFLDKKYLAENPVISFDFDGYSEEFKIFSARKTNIFDPAYQLDFSDEGSFETFIKDCGAPENSKQIITLSTCVSGFDKKERIILQAYR